MSKALETALDSVGLAELKSAICTIEGKCLQIISDLDNNTFDGSIINEIEFYANEARLAFEEISAKEGSGHE